MDLKSFYKKIDVDSIKNRFPPLPQIKMPKIKSRKIFKSSREDISQKEQQSPMGGPSPLTTQSLPPPSAFIDRTPTRISTVSSLMNINYGLRDNNQSGLSTYRTANNFEEENCPELENGDKASGSAVTKFSDRCKKTYKDFSEFKVKNIFNRKTVVKRTEIEVDIYARQYERELWEEQERDNQQQEDNVYQFEFKEARRRMSRSSRSISPPDSLASGVPSPVRSELGRLQRNETPPLLARRRNVINEAGPTRNRMQRSMSEDSPPDEPPRKPLRSSLWGISEKDVAEDTGDEQTLSSYRNRIAKMGRFRKSRKDVSGEVSPPHTDSAWNLRNIRNRFSSEDSGAERKPKKRLCRDESVEEPSDHEKRGWKLRNIHLRRSESSEKNNEPSVSSPEGKFSSIKKSLQRLNQRKPQREYSEESVKDQNQSEEPTKQNMSDQLKAGLRRLKLRERSFTFDEDAGETKAAQAKTAQAIAANKLRNWKKSFKVRRASEEAPDEDAQPSAPPRPGRSATLLRKLNHIRSRKVGSVEDDEFGDSTAQKDDSQKPRSSNLEKLDQAREKALKKVNEQVQKMKKFHGKSRDSPTESSPEKPKRTQKSLKKKAAPPGGEVLKNAPAAWTSGNVISRSLESSMDLSDDDGAMPQVLIHQDNSDQYESTLIIAVTRPAPAVPSPIIKEITPKVKPISEWIPNKNAISSFLEMSPSPPRSTRHLDVGRRHFRKQSMDSNDSDSWIPDNFRNKSSASSSSGGLNKIHENPEPWKVHSVFSEEKLYKTRSIDIFSNRDGGAFVDFDDEMKNVPVRRIAAASNESVDKETTDDDDDDYDNSSRITRVKGASPLVSTKAAIEIKGAPIPTKALLETVRSDSLNKSIDSTRAYHGSPLATKTKGQIGNSQESLDANYAESDEASSENEDDRDEPPHMAPSPPPSFSPPPPPLPLRKPPRNIPERNDSMVRLAHPLVKQASLRRHFSEEIEPSDLGKVNKLICRFEKSPSQDSVHRIQMNAGDDNDNDNDNEDEWNEQPTQVVDKKPPIKPKEDGATRNGGKKRPAPIPVPVLAPKQPDIPKVDVSHKNNNNNIDIQVPDRPVSPEIVYHQNHNQSLDNASLQSPSSVYGSPIGSVCLSISSEYGSPVGMAFPTKSTDQLRAGRRLSNRSSLRDDDTFYSFESDEENNFYSFGESSTSSTRYTIEI